MATDIFMYLGMRYKEGDFRELVVKYEELGTRYDNEDTFINYHDGNLISLLNMNKENFGYLQYLSEENTPLSVLEKWNNCHQDDDISNYQGGHALNVAHIYIETLKHPTRTFIGESGKKIEVKNPLIRVLEKINVYLNIYGYNYPEEVYPNCFVYYWFDNF